MDPLSAPYHTIDIPKEPDAPHGYLRLYCARCGQPRDIPVLCHDKTCVFCQTKRKHRLTFRALQIADLVPPLKGYSWKHIVLTQQSGSDLHSLARTIVRNFRRFRMLRYMHKRIYGGFYSLHAKPAVNPSHGKWYVHLHIVAYCSYIPYQTLTKCWSSFYPGGAHTFCRVLQSRKDFRVMMYHILSYTARPPDQMDFQSTFDYNTSLSHIRLFSYFGSIHTLARLKKPVPPLFICPACHCSSWLSQRFIDTHIPFSFKRPPPSKETHHV